ncbi:MAG: hypothetical protein OIN84_11450 [Candidatus Methanoperedens sp.]|uniref:DUF7266 family protein n=1 Tax=Candidatus Methanoperedens sp. BLZ2 TaxID=2035255 RepID=UPI000BE3FDAB|nr:hypothetical protein [Candidatus Methanoperedens sp. BLZ2]KAB2948363.1 MAG: hypothetical protein F9K14_00585 [Candidatus Methanoperedens sp.]MBZ0174552.1 type IV pilin N-terminal domain-containing protein [Candidatus Methanoperedens nitroreducens]MCX9078577.1 hypothetical protein [Candidatus Methanoperedens sp.]
MKIKKLLTNEDAVSVTIGFILMFSITVLVFSGIILSFYTLLDQSRETAMRASFDILGSGFAARVTSMDTLANITGSYEGTVNELEYDFSIPASIAGESYSINVTREKIFLDAENDAKAWIPFNSSDIINEEIYSNAQDYTLWYDNNNNTIKIKQ